VRRTNPDAASFVISSGLLNHLGSTKILAINPIFFSLSLSSLSSLLPSLRELGSQGKDKGSNV
jgi:hypothetical protein